MVPRVPERPAAPPFSFPSASSSQRPVHPSREASAHSKLSFPSSSNEADDERTESSNDFDNPLEETPTMRPTLKYSNEDTRPTSRKELAGFYVYGWAAEVFVVCGMGSFIPIALEQLARECGVLLKDRKTPCTALDLPVTAPGGPVDRIIRSSKEEAGQCVVLIGGTEINTASFAMYSFSISVFLQALIIISMSGAADHGKFRKLLLLIFAFTGAISTMLFLSVTPNVFLLGALWAIIGNCCVGASFVLLNSFLPLLVRYHPTVRDVPNELTRDVGHTVSSPTEEATQPGYIEDETVVDSLMESTSALLNSHDASGDDYTTPNPRSPATPSKELQLSTKISSYGMGIGYIAAILVQVTSIFIIVLTGSTILSLRIVLFLIGAWWLVFTIPAALWLRPRPGPPLHMASESSKLRTGWAYIKFSWKALFKTATHARRLKDVVLFLFAWFLISDAIATVSGTAVLFAKTTLHMQNGDVGLILVVATLAGILGAFTWSRISIMMGLKPTQTILACIALFELIPIYGLIGYLPFVRSWGFLGLQQPWEMFPVAAVHGFVMGGLSSYCRALFGELVPPGMEAAFFALYAVTDKGSSIFGPAIVGAITDATGEIRPAFWFLAVLIGLPFPIMYCVNVERGRLEGRSLAQELSSAGMDVGTETDEERARLMS